MHITMAFIGNVDEDTLSKTINAISKVARNFNSFETVLKRIVPGPSPLNPRMLWIEIAPNENLKQLNAWVDNALVKNHLPYEDTHAFHPHITLARGNNFELTKKINTDLDLAFIADSIDIMESQLKPDGAEYAIIKKIMLAKK